MGYKRLLDSDLLYEDDGLWKALGDRGVLIYIRMWGLSESWGGLEANLTSIARQCGAMGATVEEVQQVIKTIVKLGKAVSYSLEKRSFYWLKNVPKHNNLKKIQASKLPLPKWVVGESGEYPSGKKWWNYRILCEPERHKRKSPGRVRGVSADSPETLPRGGKRKAIQLKENKEKEKPSPLTGDDSFFIYLKANAREDCPHCQGTGVNGSQNIPCQCVMANLESRFKPLLEDAYETIKGNANPRCRECIGFGVVLIGESCRQCDCSKPSKQLRAVN